MRNQCYLARVWLQMTNAEQLDMPRITNRHAIVSLVFSWHQLVYPHCQQ